MRLSLLSLVIPLALAGCLSFSSSSPPKETVVVTPAPPSVTCANGTAPPC